LNVREGKGRPKKAFPCHSIQKRAFLCRGRPARERPPLGQGNEYVREKMMNGERKVEERRDKKSSVFGVRDLAFSMQHMTLCKHDQLLVSNISISPMSPMSFVSS